MVTLGDMVFRTLLEVPLRSSILKQNVQAMFYSEAPIYGHFSNSDWADKPGKPNFAMEPRWVTVSSVSGMFRLAEISATDR
jgi:hypothetical protein